MNQLNLRRLLPCLAFFLTLQASAQTIFVKSTASGANNGSSWANAFTSLDDALSAAGTAGAQIWIAAGTYKPNASVTPNNSFALISGVELYGGFAGTETLLSQRNYTTNVTTLSGDINGDDIADSLNLNKSDNANHVIRVSNGIPSLRAVVDGFIIRNGNTKVADADPNLSKQGGGILATAKLTVRNCHFIENAGRLGAAIAANSVTSAGLIVDNCIFEKGFTTNQCAGIYLTTSNGGLINRCIFRNNTVNRGCISPNFCKNFVVDSCLFENNRNQAAGQFGVGMFTWQSSFTVSNCMFKNNTGDIATGMYNDGRDGGDSFVVDHCTFENNTAMGTGASMYNWQANFTVKNCIFRNNNANNAAGMYNDGRENDSAFTIDSCSFENNTAIDYGGTAVYNYRTDCNILNSSFDANTAPSSAPAMYNGDAKVHVQGCVFKNGVSNFGGAIANFGEDVDATFEGDTFIENKANTSGGAIINGFKAKVLLKDCNFEGNTAKFGGAIFNQNDSTSLNIESSQFSNNNADNDGGALNVSAGITTNVQTSYFSTNTANFGGAIAVSEDSLDLGILNVDRCEFRENLAFTQAAAINVSNVDVSLTNCLFASNQNFGANPGGAISNNGSGGKTSRVSAINCTFAANVAAVGAGIAQYEDDQDGQAELNLQNNIFANDGDNYAIEAGSPSVFSMGGNVSTDNTLASALAATHDLNNTDPMFIDAGNFNFHLQPGSPCIDNGVTTGAPSVDIAGDPRIGPSDTGSYEWGTTGTHQAQEVLDLQIMPNPASDFVRTSIENDWNGPVLLSLTDVSGKTVQVLHLDKTGTNMQFKIDVKALPKGHYFAKIQMGQAVYSGRIVKQ